MNVTRIANVVMEDLWKWKFLRHGWEDLSDEEQAEFDYDLCRAVRRGFAEAEQLGGQARRQGTSVTHPTRFVAEVAVTDPRTGGKVEMEIRKDLITGAMVGLDASFLNQEIGPVYDPYNAGGRLDIPDDEPAGKLEFPAQEAP